MKFVKNIKTIPENTVFLPDSKKPGFPLENPWLTPLPLVV